MTSTLERYGFPIRRCRSNFTLSATPVTAKGLLLCSPFSSWWLVVLGVRTARGVAFWNLSVSAAAIPAFRQMCKCRRNAATAVAHRRARIQRLSVAAMHSKQESAGVCSWLLLHAFELVMNATRSNPPVESRLRRWDAVPAMPARRPSPSRWGAHALG